MTSALAVRLVQSHCCAFRSFGRFFSYQSSISLKSLYPDSTLEINTPTDKIPIKDGQKFNGFIPVDKLKITATRSSGPGGQHANKVNTKVDVRFHVDSAVWIDSEIREKLKIMYKNKTSSDGYLFVTSDKTRSQQINIGHCLEKLRKLIWDAEGPEVKEEDPEDKTIRMRRLEEANRERLKKKRMRSEVKQFRKNISGSFE